MRRFAAAAVGMALLAGGCTDSASSNPSVPSVSTPMGILTDLSRWDVATTGTRRAAAEEIARRMPSFVLLRLETFACGGQKHEAAIYKHEKSGMEFVLVPVGTFEMGSPASEMGRLDGEAQHSVTLTQPFLFARTTVTQAECKRITGTDPSRFKGDESPVEQVSWDEAKAFCDKTGLALPTEAQWEWACRAGTTTAWYFGDDESELKDYAWYAENSGFQTHPVGQKKPNAFGLFDMHGNVFQWCADSYSHYPGTPVTDPTGLGATGRSVIRGGCFNLSAAVARSAYRDGDRPDSHDAYLGFRPARSVTP